MFSELIISGTLLINAAAVLNLKLNNHEANFMLDSDRALTTGGKIKEFLASVQYFRIFIALWNFLIIFLMIVFFGS